MSRIVFFEVDNLPQDIELEKGYTVEEDSDDCYDVPSGNPKEKARVDSDEFDLYLDY